MSVVYISDDFPFKIGISFGRNRGFGEMKNGMMVPDFVIKKMKAKDVLVGRYWNNMKQKPPK